MDKNTLSNYGWIVIAVLVLAVMIALATPFGKYIESGVRSTTAGLFDTSQNAMNTVFSDFGVEVKEQTFEEGYQGVNDSTTSTPVANDGKLEYGMGDPDLNPNDGTIPSDMELYYSDLSDTYEYTYLDNYSGWSACVGNQDRTSYAPVLESINGKPVISVQCGDCYKMTSVKIPKTVTELYFYGCNSLSKIEFGGTVEEWDSIIQKDSCCYYGPEVTIICTNGTRIQKEECV